MPFSFDRLPKSCRRGIRPLILCLAGLACLSSALGAEVKEPPDPCGPLRPRGQYGPFDYRHDQDKQEIVLNAHFTPEVEALVRGNSSYIGGDIDYTLRAIPNNPRALLAMMRLGERDKTPQPMGAHYTVECYFERALRLAADDTVVRMLYVTYLIKQQREADAIVQLKEVETFVPPEDGFAEYNIALLNMDMKRYDEAAIHAQEAFKRGFMRTEVRDRLQALGKWPAESGASAESPASAASVSAPSASASSPGGISAPQ